MGFLQLPLRLDGPFSAPIGRLSPFAGAVPGAAGAARVMAGKGFDSGVGNGNAGQAGGGGIKGAGKGGGRPWFCNGCKAPNHISVEACVKCGASWKYRGDSSEKGGKTNGKAGNGKGGKAGTAGGGSKTGKWTCNVCGHKSNIFGVDDKCHLCDAHWTARSPGKGGKSGKGQRASAGKGAAEPMVDEHAAQDARLRARVNGAGGGGVAADETKKEVATEGVESMEAGPKAGDDPKGGGDAKGGGKGGKSVGKGKAAYQDGQQLVSRVQAWVKFAHGKKAQGIGRGQGEAYREVWELVLPNGLTEQDV